MRPRSAWLASGDPRGAATLGADGGNRRGPLWRLLVARLVNARVGRADRVAVAQAALRQAQARVAGLAEAQPPPAPSGTH